VNLVNLENVGKPYGHRGALDGVSARAVLLRS
jgi:hypothetical protein